MFPTVTTFGEVEGVSRVWVSETRLKLRLTSFFSSVSSYYIKHFSFGGRDSLFRQLSLWSGLKIKWTIGHSGKFMKNGGILVCVSVCEIVHGIILVN